MMIESVYDKTSSQKISATDLQKMPDVFTSIKRLGSILVCQECEGEVIARRGPGVKHFAHRAGQGENCKWVTGKTRTKGHVSANIHNGKQKGSLHQVIQEEFYDVLGRAGYQVHKPDAYFKLYEQPKFGRYPDIRVTCNNIDIVFEFQIRAIQVPDIKERTDYYKHPEVKMHWVLHDVDMNNLKSFEWDVVAAQGGVVLSVDDETREITKNSNKLTLRVSYLDFDVAKNGSVILVWKSKLEKFDDFTQNGAAQKRMLLAKTCVKNCHKLRLFEYLPLVDTVEYHLKNFASKERQDRFVKYWLELVKSKQEEKCYIC